MGGCVGSRGAPRINSYMLRMRQKKNLNLAITKDETLPPLQILLAATHALLPGLASFYLHKKDLSMYIFGSPATYAAQILFGLLATSSALPKTHQGAGQTEVSLVNVTLGHDKKTLVCSDGIQESLSPSFSRAAVAYKIPDTAITLNFTFFGFRIPVIRALSTLYEAQHQIQTHLANNTETTTMENNFEYYTPIAPQATRVFPVLVQAYEGLGLSWVQLDQILQGLRQFSSGAGVDRQPHYQELQFQVISSDEGRLGYGSLMCDPIHNTVPAGPAGPVRIAKSSVMLQERGKRVNLISGPVNDTSLILLNKNNLLSGPITEVPFPVTGTDITLAFIWLGYPLPREKVNTAFKAVFQSIAPFLQQSAQDPIPNDRYLHVSRMGHYEIAIQIHGTNHISWSQLNSVVLGLWRFTNGIGTAHERQNFRNLDYNVKNQTGSVIGYGTLLDVTGSAIGSAAPQKRSTLSSRTLKSTNIHLVQPANALSAPEEPPYSWPIQGTAFTLVFTYIGTNLPADHVLDSIHFALERIKAAIRVIPERTIPEAGFENHFGGVQVSVTPYEGTEVTWWQLGVVLKGLEEFCSNGYLRLLLFDVEERSFGRLAMGKLWRFDGGG